MRKTDRKPWRGEATLRDHTDNAIRSAPRSWRSFLRKFARWLEEERGLAASSVTVRVSSARTFLESLQVGGVRGLKSLTAVDVEDFFVSFTSHHGSGASRSMQAGLRLWLLFAASRGWVMRELVEAVPSMRSYALSTVPRGISVDGVRELVRSAAQLSTRDRAIVMLFVVYGVRRGQVVALTLDDLDWREKTIRFAAHKGGKEVLHRLVPIVADALATYLQGERPRVDERMLFLKQRFPYGPLGPSAVTQVVASALRRAGVTCKPNGPHALRHAFATRLVQHGESLKAIADLLGHTSLASVAVYAKVDHPRLLEVAAEWPEAQR